jgi:hypothetical protein
MLQKSLKDHAAVLVFQQRFVHRGVNKQIKQKSGLFFVCLFNLKA